MCAFLGSPPRPGIAEKVLLAQGQPRSGIAGGWQQQLPGALQLLPQPGGQRLPHFVQELGELYVMVPVIVPQEGA